VALHRLGRVHRVTAFVAQPIGEDAAGVDASDVGGGGTGFTRVAAARLQMRGSLASSLGFLRHVLALCKDFNNNYNMKCESYQSITQLSSSLLSR